MRKFSENVRGIIEPEFGIGVAMGYNALGHNHHFFNCPRVGDTMSQSIQKMQTACTENVVHEEEVILR